MTWHYRIRKRRLHGEFWFDIVEYYENPPGWTVDGIAPGSETREGLIAVLGAMLRDAQRYDVLDNVGDDEPDE